MGINRAPMRLEIRLEVLGADVAWVPKNLKGYRTYAIF